MWKLFNLFPGHSVHKSSNHKFSQIYNIGQQSAAVYATECSCYRIQRSNRVKMSVLQSAANRVLLSMPLSAAVSH